jgi:PTH1 family peptidyl-tRNA hydrolase
VKFKGRTLILLKPSTYMNLSGKAVNYWMQQAKIPLENLLIITDDIALPTGVIRIRAKGSDGGHNGLKSINEVLGTLDYARMRFGVGNDFQKGRQVEYVLGQWTPQDLTSIAPGIDKAMDAIKAFAVEPLSQVMTRFNG